MTAEQIVAAVREILAESPEWGPDTLERIADAVLLDSDPVTVCACCGGPCDSLDAVATDAGLAFCGSFRGRGCAER